MVSAPIEGINTMTDKRRLHGRWSEEFKRRIVAEAAASELSASEIARRNGLNPNLVFSWRKKYGAGTGQSRVGKEVCLVPVEVQSAPEETSVDTEGPAAGFLEIVLPCGSRVRCGNGINSQLLGQALSDLRPHALNTST